ncbi:MAG: hypothetical protein K9H16_01930 [Bacteroidales bacterium]|nr:hypothetical protein [Bacteroidales bacterium]
MRNLKVVTLMLLAAFALTFVACNNDDDDNPSLAVQISSVDLSDDNTTVTVTFNQAVYKNADKTGNLDANNFALTFVATNPVAAQFSVAHTAGETVATITIVYSNRLDGNETLELTAKSGSFFGAEGNSVDQDIVASTDVKELGIIGKWSAYDISLILASLGYDDSLYANFYQDQSYMVTAFVGGTPQILEGSYEMTKSADDDIWDITLNQSSPFTVISQGIFKVYPAAQDSMWYEVAQIDPAIAGVTPPTTDAGFGSTSGGAFGTMNIQKYYWVGQE